MLTNLAPFWRLFDPIIVTLFGLLGAYGLAALTSLLKISANSKLRIDLRMAVQSGVTLAVDWFKSVETHNGAVKIPNAVLAEIVEKVGELMPDIETKLKITPDTLGAMVQAGLSEWLHWNNPAPLKLAPLNASTALLSTGGGVSGDNKPTPTADAAPAPTPSPTPAASAGVSS